MQSDWELARPTGRCAATGRALAEGESYHAVLFETPQGFQRRDYCDQAWQGPPEGHFCCWRARVPVRDRDRGPIPVDHALLTQLFLRLQDNEAQAQQQFRFILALLLMRKRILRFEGAQPEGDREYWQLRLVSEQSCHRVLNPQLGAEAIERLSRQLLALLSGDAGVIEAIDSEAPAAAPGAIDPGPASPAGESPARESEDELAAP